MDRLRSNRISNKVFMTFMISPSLFTWYRPTAALSLIAVDYDREGAPCGSGGQIQIMI